MKRLESFAHIAMGFFADFLPFGGLLLHLREWRKLPPENERYPVFLIEKVDRPGVKWRGTPVMSSCGDIEGCDTYWSKVRTLDTLRDLWEYQVGKTIVWFVSHGLAVWAGIEIGRRVVG